MGPQRRLRFTTSGKPTVGTCAVDPMIGSSGSTLFNVECMGFSDDDEPLLYSIEYINMFGDGKLYINMFGDGKLYINMFGDYYRIVTLFDLHHLIRQFLNRPPTTSRF